MLDLIPDWASWYWIAALAYAALGTQVFLPSTGSLLRQHRLALAAAGLAWGTWFALAPRLAWTGPQLQRAAFVVEFLFLLAWFALLYRLLRGPYKQSMPETVRRGLYLFWGLLVAIGAGAASLDSAGGISLVVLSPILMAAALACLALLTQLQRDSPLEDRRMMLAFVAGGTLVAGTQAVHFTLATLGVVPGEAWKLARVIPLVLAAALLIHAARQRPQWSLAIFVSPQARAYAPRLLGTLGLLAALLALAPVLATLPPGIARGLALTAVFGVGLPVFVVLFSEGLGARLRVFISKHFLPFRYDYREEWLRLIDTLAAPVHRRPLPERTIKALAQIVGSPAGILWLRRQEDDPFVCAANWKTRSWPETAVPGDDPVLAFMRERQWILDTAELNRDPELYSGLRRPDWLDALPDALLVVPLISREFMIGFIVLFQSSSAFRLTFEEIDLLRTSGRQVAAYLAQYQSDQQLAEAQQFEAFNRLTAFVMHDLKNLIAQQSLVVKNAAKHKGNPDFFEDAIRTIDNSVARMSRLLKQLQSGEAVGPLQRVRLSDALKTALERAGGREPAPEFEPHDHELVSRLDRERFVDVVSHLVRNAQEATQKNGQVRVALEHENGEAVISVEDDGMGMDPEFVRTRLFRPFDSTKGSQGMGIGAYQARTFAVAAGGRLEVWSQPGMGTRVKMRLPVVESDQSGATDEVVAAATN
ncbi:MAG: PEP-CTERM system histidine kinase PrsK [Chromatiales bacterium]|nr:MAG: PEP-CTERM system histidine kinase PrsK [Chromatiales bacterium]